MPLAALDGIVQMGSYDGTPAENFAELLALIGSPDDVRSDGRAAGSNLDEMSPVAKAQLYVEVSALRDASDAGGDGVAYGFYTVTAGDATANLVNIVTGLADTTVANIAVTVSRAGSIVTADAVITEPAPGTIRVADGSTYNTTAGDIIAWFARDPSA